MSYGDGSIFYEQGRGRWVGSVDVGTDGNGRRLRRRVTGPSRKAVRDKMRKLAAERTSGLPLGDGNVTVAAFLEDWLAHVVPATAKSPNTVDNYAWAVRKHLIPAIGGRRLSALTPDDVDAMLRAKARAGMARNSLMRIRAVLVKALRHAERRGRVPRNVAALVDTPAGPRKEARALTVEQAQALLRQAEGDPLEALYT